MSLLQRVLTEVPGMLVLCGKRAAQWLKLGCCSGGPGSGLLRRTGMVTS